MNLSIEVNVRTRNERLVKGLFAVLGFVAPVLPNRAVIALGNAALKLFRVETKIGNGDWSPLDHGIRLETA